MPMKGEHQTDYDTKVEKKKPDESLEENLEVRIKLTFNTLKACERARDQAKRDFADAALDIAYYTQSVDRERRLLNELGQKLVQEVTKKKPSEEMAELQRKFGS